MKNIFKITTIAMMIMLISAIFISAQEHNHNHKTKIKNETHQMMDITKIDKNKDGYVYQCPMKCEAPKDASGECSKCGMALKKTSIKDMMKKKGEMMDNKKMKHDKKSKNHIEMMNKGIKMKGMENMKMQSKQKMKTLKKK